MHVNHTTVHSDDTTYVHHCNHSYMSLTIKKVDTISKRPPGSLTETTTANSTQFHTWCAESHQSTLNMRTEVIHKIAHRRRNQRWKDTYAVLTNTDPRERTTKTLPDSMAPFTRRTRQQLGWSSKRYILKKSWYKPFDLKIKWTGQWSLTKFFVFGSTHCNETKLTRWLGSASPWTSCRLTSICTTSQVLLWNSCANTREKDND